MSETLPGRGEELLAATIKGAVSVIPVVGGLIAELGSCLANPVERRKSEWCRELEQGLKELREQHQRLPQALSEDPEFVSALLSATSAALATHHQAKRSALRRYLVAVGAKSLPTEELQHAIVRLINDFSVGHLEVLRFLVREELHVSKVESLEQLFISYQERHGGVLSRMAFRWIVADLQSRMVIHLGDIRDMEEYSSRIVVRITSSSGIRHLQVTDLGRSLIRHLM